MKHQKHFLLSNLPITLLSILFFFLCLFSPPHQSDDSVICELSDKLLRFRVLANSDSAADQLQKNKVSAELATLLRPILSGCTSKEEAQLLLADSLLEIEDAAAALTDRYGEPYPVNCTLTKHQFPLKVYQDLTFPAGTYDTLLITIGNGDGSNWWCLAYPPLCFAEEAYVTVPTETRDSLEELLSERTWAAVSGQSLQKKNQQSENTSEKPKFCFRLLTFLNDLL